MRMTKKDISATISILGVTAVYDVALFTIVSAFPPVDNMIPSRVVSQRHSRVLKRVT
jgi:hypothetical protein